MKKNLSQNLLYHSVQHTIDVIANTAFIANKEEVSQRDILFLKIAALFHDSGFTSSYNGHEEISCEIARNILPNYSLDDREIEKICDMIMATKRPHKPVTHLDKILIDADLMYLGTDYFNEGSSRLYKELRIYIGLKNIRQWNKIQAVFLQEHVYFTVYCQKNYEPKKQKHLRKIIQNLKQQ